MIFITFIIDEFINKRNISVILQIIQAFKILYMYFELAFAK